MEESTTKDIDPKIADLDHRSEAMSELVSNNPDMLTRWTLPITVAIILSLVCATYFIHYPETIKTRARLTALNTPKSIRVLQEGRLSKLLVKNEDKVEKGQVIGFMENTASHDQVLRLSRHLDDLLELVDKNKLQEIPQYLFNETSKLGELQPYFQSFMLAFQTYVDYMSKGFYARKKNTIKEDIGYLAKNYDFLLQQKEIMQKDIDLAMEGFTSNDSLFKEKIISTQDFRNEKSKVLSKQLGEPQIGMSLLSNEIQRREKNKEISEIEHAQSQQGLIFRQSILTFQSQLNEWMKKYIIQSPIAGTISFAFPLQEQELITGGMLLGYVIPGSRHYIAEVNLPQANFGKIKSGQTVQLQFAAYPFAEYGHVIATMYYISQLPTDSGYVAYLELPNGLVTNHHKKIEYRAGLIADAIVITKDMRLLDRFYRNIADGMKK